MTTTQRMAIAPNTTTEKGMQVFDTTTNSIYFWNGTAWITAVQDNIYSANGTLTGARTVTQGSNTLAFTSNVINGFSVDGTTFSIDAASNKIGIKTTTPTAELEVVGTTKTTNLQITNGATAGNVLTSDASGNATWKSPTNTPGSLSVIVNQVGTTTSTINQGSTVDVPGLTYTHTVPSTVASQTLFFTITGYAPELSTINGAQGTFNLLQNGTKISSSYFSTTSAPVLQNLPSSSTLIKGTTLPPGTYTFTVTCSAWFGNVLVNYIPTIYSGYNNDPECMKSKMTIQVFNN
jgi:hypothetical protein